MICFSVSTVKINKLMLPFFFFYFNRSFPHFLKKLKSPDYRGNCHISVLAETQITAYRQVSSK